MLMIPSPNHPTSLRNTIILTLTATGLLIALLLGLLGIPSTVWAWGGQTDPIEVLSNEDTTCYFFTTDPDLIDPVWHIYDTADIAVTIPYTGVIEEATLLMRSANVRGGTHHPIIINGVDTGYAPPPDDYRTCDEPRPPIREYPLDLNQVPIYPGVNIIRLTTVPTSDNWAVDYLAIRVRGHDIKGGRFEKIVFPGEHGDQVEAEVLLPYDWQPNSPLLLLFHGWRGHPIDPFFTDYTPAIIDQGWIAVSPQQRGQNTLGPGGQPLASLSSQHDAFQLLQYMQTHYPYDPDRVYVGGFSMGGMMAGTMAAKYPDIFAAAVTHMAITDLRAWYYEVGEYRQSQIITETGGTPTQVPFEYIRRSPRDLATNLKTVPLAIIHGSEDIVVQPHQAQDFYEAVQAVDPVHAELHWYPGGHDPAQTPPLGGVWAVNFMKNYVRNDHPTSLRIRTDEAKSFYWLDIKPQKTSWRRFTEVDVDIDPHEDRIWAEVRDSQPVEVSFRLADMGLDPRSSYVISQTNDLLGSSIEAATPLDGRLNVSVPKGTTQLEIFPNHGDMPVQLILQRDRDGYTGVQDAWINQWSPDHNYGETSYLSLRPNQVQRGLIRFDLQGLLPDHIQITSAHLYLYDNASSPQVTVALYPLIRDWEEGEVTYQQAAQGQPWTQPGGDIAAEPIATVSLPGEEPGFVSINILDSVKDWVADPAGNHGLLLDLTQAQNPNLAHTFKSSEYWDASLRPYLKIIYQPLREGEIHGIVYEDSNGNRQHDAHEPLLAGATLQLIQNGQVIQEQTTGPDGTYQLTRLLPGSYQLVETPPPGYGRAQPADHLFFTLNPGDDLAFNFAHPPRLLLPLIMK